MRTLIILALGAPLGYLLATPLLVWADRLLARVAPADAAPLAYAASADQNEGSVRAGGLRGFSPPSANSFAGSSGAVFNTQPANLPTTLTAPWRWALRLGLAVLVPLVLLRAVPAGHHLAPWSLLALLVAVLILALVAVMDGATHLIFGEILAWPALAGVLLALPRGLTACLPLLMGALACGGLLAAIYLLGLCVYGTDALGWGDVQLAAVIGLLLGWPGGLRAIIWGFLLMLVIAGALLLTRRITRHSYLPLGVFLVLGALLSLLLQPPFAG